MVTNRKVYKVLILWFVMAKTKENVQTKVDNSWKRKIATYGSNFIVGVKPVQNVIGKGLETLTGSAAKIGNPAGAIVYGGLDLLRNFAPKVKQNKYFRLAEAAGTGMYALATVRDLFGILKGDMGSLAQLPFDAAMLYEVGKNTIKDYKKKSIKDDLAGVVEDGSNTYKSVRNIRRI
jgi:hypothetical protein